MTSAEDEEGWEPSAVSSRFGRLLGPLKRRRVDSGWRYGIVAHEGLSNEAGILHGGAITALFDEVIGTIINAELDRPHMTIHFSTVFLGPVHIGDTVEFTHEIVKATRSMTFVEGRLIVHGAIAAKADMVFKVRRSDPV